MLDDRLIVPPTQAGPSLDGTAASVFTVTIVTSEAEQPDPGAVTVTVYVPAIAVVAPVVSVGF